METPPLNFFPQRDRHDEHGEGDNFKSRNRPLVTRTCRQHELHRIGRCGDEYSKLVRESGNQPARFIRGKLVQMDRDHSPCALHAGLHQKRANGQHGERAEPAKGRELPFGHSRQGCAQHAAEFQRTFPASRECVRFNYE